MGPGYFLGQNKYYVYNFLLYYAAKRFTMSECVIWIVDDDADDIALIKQAFLECSFDVRIFSPTEAKDLIPALERTYARDLPQVILLDINMPGISGRQLLSRIRGDERFRHIPVVMFTTSNSRIDRNECLKDGANSFLTKPNSYKEMVKVCSSLATVFCTPEFSNHK
ncbi:MAG: response regulator receiver protein [Chitinophagaceae bacterium]|nr:response regulator receiver protein [Chitinophagaceae bacterium]